VLKLFRGARNSLEIFPGFPGTAFKIIQGVIKFPRPGATAKHDINACVCVYVCASICVLCVSCV
jgi:hypothetical protein